MIRHDDIATVHTCHDATDKPYDLMAFRGTELLLISLRRSRDNEIRLNRWQAAEFARALDHFNRHLDLPTTASVPDPDYHI